MASVAPEAAALPLPTYLKVEEVAALLHQSPRSIHERTSNRSIPMRKMRGTRRVLIPSAELIEWLDGSALEVVEAGGNVIVRPVASAPRLHEVS